MTKPIPPSSENRRSTPPTGGGAPGRPGIPASSRGSWRERSTILNTHATVVAITAVVLALALGLIAYGYWDSYIHPARQAAVHVGDRSYDMTYLVRRVKQFLNEPAGASLQPTQMIALPSRVAGDIKDEEVVLQRAASLGIGVSDDEIDKDLATRVRAVATPNEAGQLTRSPILESAVREALKESGLTLAQFRRSVHGQLLARETRKYFENKVPDSLPAVHVRVITVGDEAKAKDLKQQLDNGADFAEIASSSSTDSSKGQGGLRDWAPKGSLPAAVEDAAYALPIGKLSDLIKADDTWYLVKVEERSENREVTPEQKTQLARKQYDDWLAEQAKQLNAKSYLDDQGRQTYAIEHSGARERAARSTAPGGQQAPLPINVPPSGGQAPAPAGGNP